MGNLILAFLPGTGQRVDVRQTLSVAKARSSFVRAGVDLVIDTSAVTESRPSEAVR
jgi:hypothetical protein